MQNAVWTGFSVHLEHGLAILRLQRKLYCFLVQCAEILLHDIDLSGPKIEQSQTHVQEMPQETLIPGDWQSLSEKNIRISYQLPQSFSVVSLRKLVDVKRDEAQDLFWAVRIDPEYFQAQVALRSQESLEPARWVSQQRRSTSSSRSEDEALKQGCMRVIQIPCHDIILWEEIAFTVAEVELSRTSLGTQPLDLSKRMPSRYEKALERLVSIMTVGWEYAVRDLHRIFLGSPEYTQFFELVPVKGEEDEMYSDWVRKTSNKDYWPPLMILLADLKDLRLLNRLGALNVLDEMERMMSQPSQRTKFGPEILKVLSKLAAFAEIRDMLNRHQPTIQCSQDYNIMVAEDFTHLGVIDKLEDLLAKIPLIEYFKPNSAFNYPV